MKPRRNRLRGLVILHEDDALIVVEKSEGLLTCATRRGEACTVESQLTDYVRKGQARSRKCVYLVHRLDRETSGVMMVAKTEAVQEYFRSSWNEITEKTYLARVVGIMPQDEGVFESYLADDPRTLKVRSVAATPPPPNAKFARTRWRVLSATSGRFPTSLVEVKLHTGRRNQIRVHFAEAGHPVLGDAKYGRGGGGRLCLHALELAFIHPLTKERVAFSASRPSFADEARGAR